MLLAQPCDSAQEQGQARLWLLLQVPLFFWCCNPLQTSDILNTKYGFVVYFTTLSVQTLPDLGNFKTAKKH
jgi:hypothetical protein